MMPRPIRITYTIPVGAQFGAPRGNGTRIHQGCDYHCPIGTPIYGTADGGKVIFIGYNGNPLTGSGNNVVIAYPDSRITTDMHLRERTPLHVGSPVNTDTIVGYVGITGNAVNADPPGSHDHHQMTLNGKLINPEAFYGSQPAGTGTAIPEQKEDHEMRVYQISDGGLKGTIWGLAPGAMFNAKDGADGLLMASALNPDGKLIPKTEKELRTIAGYLGVPDNLIAGGMAGVNWSWAKDALTKSGGTVINATGPDATQLEQIVQASEGRIINAIPKTFTAK